MNPFEVLKQKKCGFTQLTRIVNTEEKAIAFFKHVKLICLRRRKCRVCKSPMLPVPNQNTKLKKILHCLNTAKCGTFENPLRKSWFENSNLPFQKIFDLVVNWLFRQKRRELSTNSDVSSAASVKWILAFRKVCHMAVSRQPNKIGGPGLHVEVDESFLFRRKYHRGHKIKGESVWVLGGICRETKERFVIRIANRGRKAIWDGLRKHIAQGSILVTDGYVAYTGVNVALNFAAHEVVVHKENFVNPIFREIHTNTVEGMWGKLKRQVGRTGTNEQIDMSLSEYVYRCHLASKFGETNYGSWLRQFFRDVRRQFPGK